MKELIYLPLFTIMLTLIFTIPTFAQNSEKKILRHWHEADSVSQRNKQAKSRNKSRTVNKKAINVPK